MIKQAFEPRSFLLLFFMSAVSGTYLVSRYYLLNWPVTTAHLSIYILSLHFSPFCPCYTCGFALVRLVTERISRGPLQAACPAGRLLASDWLQSQWVLCRWALAPGGGGMARLTRDTKTRPFFPGWLWPGPASILLRSYLPFSLLDCEVGDFLSFCPFATDLLLRFSS